MACNVLKWSCSRSKFGQVSAAKRVFEEDLGRMSNTTWKLQINNDQDSVTFGYPKWGLYLSRRSCDENIKLNFKLLSNNKVQVNRVINFDTDINSQYLFDYNTENLIDYRLDLFFIFEASAVKNKVFEEFQIVKLQSLSTSLQTMLEKEHMTDVVLKCGSVVLKAHKSIITIHSPVFEAMFANPMLEKEMDTVVIKDMDPSVLRVMVRFMYSGQVKVESEVMAYDLLYAAEKYQIGALKGGCIDYLKAILSCENALKILEISNLFDKQLKLDCLNYVKNRYEELKLTKDWKDLKLKNPVLALEIYSYNESD